MQNTQNAVITEKNYSFYVDYLNSASTAYYEGKPTMPDVDFDYFMDALEAFEQEHPELVAKNSPTKNVGSDIAFGFEKVKHEIPMLSIAKVTEFEKLEEWIKDIESKVGSQQKWSLESKVDGSSLSLFYKDGKLVRGVTRGRGDVGDLIGDSVFAIGQIPHVLSNVASEVEIRGEVVIFEEAFQKINKELTEKGEKTYSNSRNLASGSLKLKDIEEVKNRRLTFIAYSIVKGGTDTQRGDILKLVESGFTVPANSISESVDFIRGWIESVGENRSNLPYQIDGIVIKLNDKLLHKKLGGTSKTPHFLKAFKFAAETGTPKLENVTFQVGRTGVVSPVGHFEGIQLAGVIIKKCTLHNFDFINGLGIQIGDEVVLARNGDVIPGVRSLHKMGENRTPILPPENCPECLVGKVERVDGEVVYKCMNPDCSAKILGKFKHFCSKHSMDMYGLSEKTLEQLIDLGLVKEFDDLFDLTEASIIAKVPRMGDKKAENIVNAIQSSKNRGLVKLLIGLSIGNSGEGTAKRLGETFKSMEAIKKATFEEFTAIPDIGPTTARNIFDWFAEDENWNLIKRLQAKGIKMDIDEVKVASNKLEGKTFVITGTLSQPRDFFSDLIEKNGGKVSGSISKTTTYLLAGDKAGSKMDKAEKLGVEVIDEATFSGMI